MSNASGHVPGLHVPGTLMPIPVLVAQQQAADDDRRRRRDQLLLLLPR